MERPLDVTSYLYNVSRVAFLFFPRLLAKWARIVWNRIREPDKDLKDLVVVLDDMEKTPLRIKSLGCMHNVLTKTIGIILGVKKHRDELLQIRSTLQEICDLIHTYHENLQHALIIADHRLFPSVPTPDDDQGIPEYFQNPFLQLCTNLKHVLSAIQTTRKTRPWISRQSKSNYIRQCHREAVDCLGAIQSAIIPKTIYHEPLDPKIRQYTLLDVMKNAEPQRYRLIDCSQLTQHQTLSICEFVPFPHVRYAAVSYVWRGNAVPEGYLGIEFSIVGAEAADPIGVEVLHDTCMTALAKGATHIWIDRLCIMQTSKVDKNWQIREMYHMYRSCSTCIVVPAGLRRLVPLDEETGWIHRGWTLQEAIAPPDIDVIFSWKLGTCKARSGERMEGELKEVVIGRTAMTPLSLLLDACTTGYLSVEYGDRTTMLQVKTFSPQPLRHTYNDIPFWRPTRRIMPPNVSALAIAMSNDMSHDEKEYAIWKSALMRTSSRPVDMIFSIMGLFGIALDTTAFNKDDRIGATIALARAILGKGGRANWLGLSFHIDPCPFISTFPTFPRTRVSGKALVRVAEGKYREPSELMENEYPIALALVPLPQGKMDEDGYLTIIAKARLIVPCSTHKTLDDDPTKPTYLTAVDDSSWELCDVGKENSSNTTSYYAVVLGFFNGYFPGSSPAIGDTNCKLILAEEHDPGKYHIKSYFMLSGFLREWLKEWPQKEFAIGGPSIWKKELIVPEDPEEPLEEMTRTGVAPRENREDSKMGYSTENFGEAPEGLTQNSPYPYGKGTKALIEGTMYVDGVVYGKGIGPTLAVAKEAAAEQAFNALKAELEGST